VSEESRGDLHEYDAGSYIGEDRPPGVARAAEPHFVRREVTGYITGLAIAVALTIASFWVDRTTFIYGPALAVALLVLAVAQMGIHLIFFLHITTDPDNTNNIMALAFGVLIVCLIVFGSIWVMTHMNANMMPMPMEKLLQMQP
jgi:cytochrome o ubiquinol oxidase operon protein cyoD